jgi:nucleoside-diphosphate-sugar epimerase
MSKGNAVVCGGGGFIGGHLVRALLDTGHYTSVRAVDLKPLDAWQSLHRDAENLTLDLRDPAHCRTACAAADVVYNLAGTVGGQGYLATHKADCMLAVLPDTNLLVAARDAGTSRFFYASSACVYNTDRQSSPDAPALRESDAYPALPDDGYGWEKLFAERMCRHFREDFGLPTRVARLHAVYGPHGPYDGGRERAPAAVCRKVVEAKLTGRHEIDIWGDGSQTRSFTYVSDAVDGIQRVTHSPVTDPLNLGSAELVSIDHLVTLVEQIAGLKLRRTYRLDAPTGVTGRNSDNTLVRQHLHWEPSTKLRDGLERTYRWVYDDFLAHHGPYPSAATRPVFHSRPIRLDSFPP